MRKRGENCLGEEVERERRKKGEGAGWRTRTYKGEEERGGGVRKKGGSHHNNV